jgi:acyl carrier protein
MVSKERVFELIQDSFGSLQRAGLIVDEIVASAETVLLGIGSPLDSVGFVTFIAELEDRLYRETGRDIYLILDDIHTFNIKNPHLSIDALARYIAMVTGNQEEKHG